jgi:preprotein translocase subunit SecB
MEDSAKNNSQIKLESILLIKSNFFRDLIIDAQDKSKIVQDLNIDITNSELKSDRFSVYLHLDFNVLYDSKKLIEINVIYSGTFNKSNTSADDNALENFININAPAIIFPFVREEIAAITSKAGIGTVLLQPVNLVELSKKKKQKD